MATDAQKILVVVGGTGRTGKSVAQSLHGNPNFHVKVTTRDTSSDRAQFIRSLGIEVVQADSWNPDEMDKAFAGAWGVYMNTNSEAPDFTGSSTLRESDMGKIVIDAARRQNVEVFVFAGLPEAARITDGKCQISTFNQKNEISRYGQAAGFKTFTNVNVGWQMENFWNPVYEVPFGGFARRKDDDGYLTIKIFPMGNTPESTPWTSIRDDYGDIVHGVFHSPAKWNNQTVWAVSHPTSFQSVADAYNRVTGTQAARYLVPEAPAVASSPEKANEVNGIGNYVKCVKGNYCNGSPVDQAPAIELKKAGALARGNPMAETELQTIEGFIRVHAFKGEDM
ncbi:unnamed protein product [Clonostachys byssicola]|uniref:NmrA-like domain-containing protein n=1 Tax=Clonostachys byssicola TaxID=160290 RepID=A0A9N9URQ2_9HYPO|nr:unnamed protein product [Clonostachys byssicola]